MKNINRPCKHGHNSGRYNSGGCKECHKNRASLRYYNNKDFIIEYQTNRYKNKCLQSGKPYLSQAERRNKTPEHKYKPYHKNKQKQALYYKNFVANNPGKLAFYTAKRRCAVLRATPKWANEFFIEEAYNLAKLRQEVTGFEWHVDHIYPIQGLWVCGLHTIENLQVIPKTDNLRKHRRYISELHDV